MYITSPIFLSISKALSILCFQSLGYITLEVSQSTLSFPWKWRGTRRKEAGKFSMFTLEKNLEPDISTTHWGTLQKSGKLQCNFLFQFLLKKKKKRKKSNQPNPNESSLSSSCGRPHALSMKPIMSPITAEDRRGCSTAPAASGLPSLLLLQGFISYKPKWPGTGCGGDGEHQQVMEARHGTMKQNPRSFSQNLYLIKIKSKRSDITGNG